MMALIRYLILLAVTCKLADSDFSLPGSTYTKTYRKCSEDFVSNLRHIINIGSDVYLSRQDEAEWLHDYNIEKGIPSGKCQCNYQDLMCWRDFFDSELFAMRAIVPLTDFCLNSPLCTDGSWNELENVVLIYGAIMYWSWTCPTCRSPEGFFLARRTINPSGLWKQKFTLITNETVSENLLEKMRMLNFTLLERDDEIRLNRPHIPLSIAPESYFKNYQPSLKKDFRFIGAVFIPSRAEMLVLATDHPYDVNLRNLRFQETYTLASSQNMYLLRRKFNTLEGQWSEIPLKQTGMEPDVQLIGLIRIGENVYLVNTKTEFFDVVWGDQDEISIKRSDKAKILDCDYGKSKLIKN